MHFQNKRSIFTNEEKINPIYIFSGNLSPLLVQFKIACTKELFLHDGHLVSYDDPTYTFRLGIDVSYYQGIIDWKEVKADGYEFQMPVVYDPESI